MSTIKNLYEKCIKDFNVTRDYNFKYCNCETNKCYQHRALLRDAYHTRRYIDIWANVVISYFVNNAEYEKYDVIINELIERSSVDLEIYLRELYERLFITKSDYGHQRWLNGRKFISNTYNNNKIKTKSYWTRLIFFIKVENYVYLDYFNCTERLSLFTGNSQKLRREFKHRRAIDLVCVYNLIVSHKQDECTMPIVNFNSDGETVDEYSEWNI
ncbi:uncharacterized protein LOC126908977 [Daktulosphaira vitifoliae]|uniref:uncharacterized protein LOC126908977 n=1 Tax=Daktulosphaira vitifoliae TaxID=58002 RepID=UPI0021AA9606|nr:uncharacterized protein LOC126908977 [Daktulosphaira vitifoliae]